MMPISALLTDSLVAWSGEDENRQLLVQ